MSSILFVLDGYYVPTNLDKGGRNAYNTIKSE